MRSPVLHKIQQYILWEPHVDVLLRLRIDEEHPIGTGALYHADMQGVPLGVSLCRLCVLVDEARQARGRIGVASRDPVNAAEDGDRADGNPKAQLLTQLGQHTVERRVHRTGRDCYAVVRQQSVRGET